jgi:hypothetical protein
VQVPSCLIGAIGSDLPARRRHSRWPERIISSGKIGKDKRENPKDRHRETARTGRVRIVLMRWWSSVVHAGGASIECKRAMRLNTTTQCGGALPLDMLGGRFEQTDRRAIERMKRVNEGYLAAAVQGVGPPGSRFRT